MKSDDFFAIHKTFTFKELKLCLSKNQVSSVKSSTLQNLLTYHQKQAHILHIRRGLYYSVPKGLDSTHCPIDPFLVASKMQKTL